MAKTSLKRITGLTPREFIEKAIAGGWDGHGGWEKFEERVNDWWFYDEGYKSRGVGYTIKEILLQPGSWKAVRKELGESNVTWVRKEKGGMTIVLLDDWENKMFEFLYDLITSTT